MKRFLFFALVFMGESALSQPVSHFLPDSALTYAETIVVNGVSKQELFTRARDWVSINLNDLEIQDPNLGEVSGKGSLDCAVTFRFLGAHEGLAAFSFSMSLWVQDGKYHYQLTDIINTAVNGDNSSVIGKLYHSPHCLAKVPLLSQRKLDESYQSAKDGFSKEAAMVMASLKKSLENPSTPVF